MLFKKENDLILKITNLILVLWLIGSICFFQASLTDLLFSNKTISLEQYEKYYCYNFKYDENTDCKKFYAEHLRYLDEQETSDKRNVLLSLGSIVIVSTGLYFLNKGRKEK